MMLVEPTETQCKASRLFINGFTTDTYPNVDRDTCSRNASKNLHLDYIPGDKRPGG